MKILCSCENLGFGHIFWVWLIVLASGDKGTKVCVWAEILGLGNFVGFG